MSHAKTIIRELETEQHHPRFPDFRVGDTVRVHVRIVEGDKERVQVFEGVVIRRRRGGNRGTFTVRKVSYGVGVERTFPYSSPRVEKVDRHDAGPRTPRPAVLPPRAHRQGRPYPRAHAHGQAVAAPHLRTRPPPGAPTTAKGARAPSSWPPGTSSEQGYRILERNYRCRAVRSTSSPRRTGSSASSRCAAAATTSLGDPLETLIARKRARMIHAARHYLAVRRSRSARCASTWWGSSTRRSYASSWCAARSRLASGRRGPTDAVRVWCRWRRPRRTLVAGRAKLRSTDLGSSCWGWPRRWR